MAKSNDLGKGSPRFSMPNLAEVKALVVHTVFQGAAVGIVAILTWLIPLIPVSTPWGIIAVGVASIVLKVLRLWGSDNSTTTVASP